jgi:glycosyltransferase involved in cell wall biosynthesis
MGSVGISVIIPIYNAEAYLDKCLSSIEHQDMHSYEVILVDDGSTDSSPLICDRISATDQRFKAIHIENGGVSSARNAGLSVAEGEYVMFVDSDDILSPGALTALMNATEHKPDFVLGGFNIYNENIYFGDVLPAKNGYYNAADMGRFLEETMVWSGRLYRGPWAKLYRTDVIRNNRLLFNEALCYAEDKLFIYEFLNHASSASSVTVSVYDYFRRAGTLSGGRTTERRASQLLEVVPLCAESMNRLENRYPGSRMLKKVYHNDIICSDLMRVLRYFMKKPTSLLTQDNISIAYEVMKGDSILHLLERRVPGQMFNTLLYKIGSPAFSCCVYKLVSSLLKYFYA